jgi:hypothetical protein
MKVFISAALLSLALAGPALAFQCPADMAAIDQALQTAQITDEQKAQVMQLREEGERLHSSGQHQQSVDALAQAKEILGIQ